MIIWINGAFGSGKTQTAFELQRRLPDAYVYDPENIGYFIRKNVPAAINTADDFQNYPMWREFNYSMLKHIGSNYSGVTIVPMTVVDPQFFGEIIGRLRDDGVSVHHFTLSATKEVLLKRLKSRRDGTDSWPAKQIDRCIDGLSNSIFNHHIDTNEMTIDNVVEKIAALSDVTLLPDKRSAMAKKAARIITQLRHIRFFL